MKNRNDFAVREGYSSDAPLRSDRVVDGDGAQGLLRTLDPLFAGDSSAREAFHREIEAAAAIPPDHPMLVAPVAWQSGEDPFLVRPFLPDGSLQAWLAYPSSVAPEHAVHVLAWLAEALEEVARLGLTHGDPGPRNLLLSSGWLRLSDPASSRLRFASNLAPARVEQRAGTPPEVLLRLLGRLLDRKAPPSDDPLRQELDRLLFCNLRSQEKVDRLRQLAGSVPRPPLEPVFSSAPAPDLESAPMPVIVTVELPPDPARAAEALRISIPFSRSPMSHDPEPGPGSRLELAVEHPDPCGAVVQELRQTGARVAILSPAFRGMR